MSINPLIKAEVNEEQLKAVTQLKNCVVAAGAGSGKTRVLAYRYAHLVIEHNYPVESILTLTFTKKATAEMFSRIYETLKKIAEDKNSTNEQKNRATTAIEEFHTARIQTLDSFCSSIVRSASRKYGIRPDFAIDNNAVYTFCAKTARDFMLKYRNNPYIQEISGTGRYESIADTLFVNPIFTHSNIANPIDFYKSIPNQISEILKIWEECFSECMDAKINLEEEISVVQEHFDSIENSYIDSTALKSYFSIILDNTKSADEKEAVTHKLSKDIIQYANSFQSLKSINKTKIKNKDRRVVIDDLRATYAKLSPIPQYILYFPQVIQLIPILEEAQTLVTEWKRSTGNLTYSDVANLALKILIEQPDIRKSEKLKTNAIMIDEFQDNNAMQKDMLFLLAENIERMEKSIPLASELCPEKLFFVGDEKQSIYKFRGADVSVFRSLKAEMEPNNLTLSTNYRSHPQLISGFNALFGGFEYNGADSSHEKTQRIKNSASVFIQEHQLQDGIKLPLFEAEYEQSYSRKFEEHELKTKDDKRIHFAFLNKTDMDEENEVVEDSEEKEDLVEAENLAIFTAEKIEELCKSDYKPENIAILLRSYSNQSLYEKHLRRKGIPYVAENITNFFGDAPINDICAFIRLLVYPRDTISYGTVLRSPFVGLSQQDSLFCILESEKNNKEDIIFNANNATNLSSAAKQVYINGLESYNSLRLDIQNITCAKLVTNLWYNKGYRFETIWNLDVSLFSELYDFLFQIACELDAEGKNISYFTDYLLELQVNEERLDDMNIPLERGGAVQLMSIHKSKGLEFPIVFVGGISSKSRPNTNEDMIFVDKEYGPSFNFPAHPDITESSINYFFEKSKIKTKLMSEAELRRVLYVAMTRAESELYITGSISLNKNVKEMLETVFDENQLKSNDPVDIENKLFTMLHAIRSEQIDKDQKNNSVVKNEYCREDDKFIAFLLPLLAYFMNKDAPFTLEEIKSRTQEELRTFNVTKKETKQEVFERVQNIYDTAEIIETTLISSPYKNPSHLSHEKDIDYQKNDNNDNGEFSLPELDDIIKKQADNGFDYSHFGTIAHAFAESLFTKKDAQIPAQIMQKLKETQFKTVCKLAENMAKGFANSELGKAALTSKWQKTEHTFKYLIKNANQKAIINGSIDLVFEKEDGNIVIVDYKTDSVENPSIHIAQVASYQQAVSKILAKPIESISCYLFYLRTSKAVDITKECITVDLKEYV